MTETSSFVNSPVDALETKVTAVPSVRIRSALWDTKSEGIAQVTTRRIFGFE